MVKKIKWLYLLLLLEALGLSCTKPKLAVKVEKSILEKPPVRLAPMVDYFVKDLGGKVLEKSQLSKIIPEKEWDLSIVPIVHDYTFDAAQNNRVVDTEQLDRLRQIVLVDRFSDELASNTMAVCTKYRYKFFASTSSKSKVLRGHYYKIEVLREPVLELLPDTEDYPYYNQEFPPDLIFQDSNEDLLESESFPLSNQKLAQQQAMDRFQRIRNDLLRVKWVIYHQLTHCLLDRSHQETKKGIMKETYPEIGFDFNKNWKNTIKTLFYK